MTKCPACGGLFRKGSLAIVIGRRARRTRVCPQCAQRSVRVVAPVVPAEAAPAMSPMGPQAFASLVIRQLRALARGAELARDASTKPTAPDGMYHSGRVSAYEGAIELVKRLAEQES